MHVLAVEGSTQIDTATISILLGVVIPIVVGIVTKIDAAPGLKAVLNALLSAITGALNLVLTNEGALVWREFVTSIALAWLVSVATYYGLWKPTGVAGTVATATARVGIGSPPRMETEDKGMEDLGAEATPKTRARRSKDGKFAPKK